MEQAYPLNSSRYFFLTAQTAVLLRNGVMALGVTGLLLLGMTQLIATDYRPVVEDPPPKIAPIHMPPVKPTVNKTEAAPRPQQLPPPVPPVQANRTVAPGEVPVRISPPVIGHENNGPLIPSSDPLPVYRPAPNYPRRALARGIEGYVVVEFTITKHGSVRNPSVVGGYDVNGEPTNIFDNAALSAVARFKYRPPVVDGIVVEQVGVRNRITFRLAE